MSEPIVPVAAVTAEPAARQTAPLAGLPREERAEAMAATVDAAFERLAAQLARGHSQGFRELLGFMAKLHKYSAANCLLIISQRPDATMVAGLRRWNELGHRVRAGEKAIFIWAPIVTKRVDALTGEECEVLVGFKPAPVFAAEQLADLAEKPLPSPFPALPDDVQDRYELVKARVERAGIRVEERPLIGGVQGVSHGGRIVVKENLDSRSRLFVLLHELGHELAHHGPDTPARSAAWRELEAEAAAHAVAAALGLEIGTSRDYLLSYRLTADDLRAALAEVQALVRTMLAIVLPGEEGLLVAA